MARVGDDEDDVSGPSLVKKKKKKLPQSDGPSDSSHASSKASKKTPPKKHMSKKTPSNQSVVRSSSMPAKAVKRGKGAGRLSPVNVNRTAATKMSAKMSSPAVKKSEKTGKNAGRTEPASRGVKRYSSMPVDSPTSSIKLKPSKSSAKELSPKSPTTQLGNLLSLKSVREQSPEKIKETHVRDSVRRIPRKPSAKAEIGQDGSSSPNKAQSMRNLQNPMASSKLKMEYRSVAMDGPQRSPISGKDKCLGFRFASMRNLQQSPTKIPATNKRGPHSTKELMSPGGSRRLPTRTKSSDLELMRREASQKQLHTQQDLKQNGGVRRSQSGDLELLSESSMHDRTDIQKPASILKNSSHQHRSILRNSSHHGTATRGLPRRDQGTRARFPGDVNISTVVSTDSDDDFDSIADESVEEASIVFDDEPKDGTSRKPRSARPGFGPRPGSRPALSSNNKSKSFMDLSTHSFVTTRSVMSLDTDLGFGDDDPIHKRVLRYIRILPPHPDEKPIKKKIRIFVWVTLMLDFIAAMVSITTYNGVTECCGTPIFSLGVANVDWSEAIRITTFVYLGLIFIEILPVVRKGLPFNLINPMLGFTITFAMFFDDRILEAVFMWIIEAMAIFCEFVVFRLQSKLYHERNDRLDTVETDLQPYLSKPNLNVSRRSGLVSSNSRRTGRTALDSSHSTRLDLPGSNHNRTKSKRLLASSQHSNVSGLDSDDESIVSGGSFGLDEGEVEAQSKSAVSYSGINGNHKLRKVRLLRERRLIRQRQKEERTQLRYHFGGVMINFGLICVSLVLIIAIASSGGLCVLSGERPVIFDMNQLDNKCGECRGLVIDGICEICKEDKEEFMCYYQYI